MRNLSGLFLLWQIRVKFTKSNLREVFKQSKIMNKQLRIWHSIVNNNAKVPGTGLILFQQFNRSFFRWKYQCLNWKSSCSNLVYLLTKSLLNAQQKLVYVNTITLLSFKDMNHKPIWSCALQEQFSPPPAFNTHVS